MKDRLLITVAAAALIAGTTFASAQPGQGGSPGAAERGGSGTMERSTGGQDAGGQGAVERGPAREGAPQQRSGQPREQRPAQMRDQNQGQAPRQGDQGQMQMQQGQERQGTTQREGTTQRQGTSQREGASQREGTSQRGQAEQGRTGQGGRTETTGRAPADVQITNEQRTQIRQRLGDNTSARIDRSKVNFSVSVGVAVPRTVRVFDLPAEIVTIVPAYRGYKYVIIEDEIVIIDPRTFRIVFVIEA